MCYIFAGQQSEPAVCLHPPPSLTSRPPRPTPAGRHWAEVPVVCSSVPRAACFTQGSGHASVPVSQILPLCPLRRRQRHPTPAPWPGRSHGRTSLVGCSPWDCKESDTTERLNFHFSLSCTGEGNGNPRHCSCLENPRDAGAWWAAVSGVAQSRTRMKRFSITSSSSSCPLCPHVSILYIYTSIPALQIGSSVAFF